MKYSKILTGAVLAIMLMSVGAWGADPFCRKPVMMDVALNGQQVLEGCLVDAFGNPLENTLITVRQQKKRIWSGRTDGQGRFRVPALTCGVYWIEGERVSMVCRVWTQPAAPPRAASSLLLTKPLTPNADPPELKPYNSPLHRMGLATMTLPSSPSRDLRSLISP